MTKLLVGRLTWRWTTLVGGEGVLLAGTIIAAVHLFPSGAATVPTMVLLPKALLAAAICQVCLYYRDLYDLRPPADLRQLLQRVLQALGVTSVFFAAVALWMPGLGFGRGILPLTVVLSLIVVTTWRFAFGWFARRVPPRERLLVVGTSAAAVSLARELQACSGHGVEIVGFIEPESAAAPARLAEVIGTVEDIPAIVRARGVARVVVHLADARGK